MRVECWMNPIYILPHLRSTKCKPFNVNSTKTDHKMGYESSSSSRERDCKCVQTTHNMYLSVNVELTVTAQNDNIPSSKHTESYEIYFHFPPIKSMIYSKHRCCGIGGSKEYHQNPSKQYERERKRDTFSCVQEKYPNHIRISYRQYSPFLLPPTVWGQSSIFPHAVCYITFHILYLVFLCCCSKQTLLDRQPHRTMPVPTPSFANRPLTTAKKVTLSLNSSRSSNNHKSSRNKNMLFQSILL